jgi:hypothetical protein
MKNPLLIALCALLLSAIGLGINFFDNADSQRDARSLAAPMGTNDGLLLERLQALADENRELRARMEDLELRPPGEAPSAQRAPMTDGFVTRGEFEAFQKEVRDLLSTAGLVVGAGEQVSPELKARISDTLEELQHEKSVKGVKNYHEKRLAELDAALPKIEEWLQLSSYQSTEMRQALLDQYDREADLVRRWENGEDDALLGELKGSMRREHREDLSQFLDPEQLDTFMAQGGGGKGNR